MNICTRSGVPLNTYEYPYANLLIKTFLFNLRIANKRPMNNPIIKEISVVPNNRKVKKTLNENFVIN